MQYIPVVKILSEFRNRTEMHKIPTTCLGPNRNKAKDTSQHSRQGHRVSQE